MSLSAKERILKLRETEYKLQKLQTDLLTGASEGSSSMADFLAHHKELMSLPTKTKNTLPFSFNQSPYYQRMTKAHKLTLPPKIDPTSSSRMQEYKDPIDESEKYIHPNTGGLARHPSLALQTLYHQLEDQTAKMAISMPKIAKGTSSMRFKNVLNSQRYITAPQRTQSKPAKVSKSVYTPRTTSLSNKESGLKSTKFPSKKASFLQKSKSSQMKKAKMSAVELQNEASKLLKLKPDLSEIVRANPASVASPVSNVSVPASEFDIHALRLNGMSPEELKNSLSFALTASNMMGVVLNGDSKAYKKGPLGWSEKASVTSAKADVNKNISAKDVLNLLKRKLPERTTAIREPVPPHQRGLIGIEISGFENECAFFYRDRNGQINPHLQSQKSTAKVFRGEETKVPACLV
ncbi:hypothetical protein Ocin01_10683 [Orchesella cincta]|uniref:Uncharacterized protein n=1 Tax=Orchesella cincta TaxID=48709 RepID=A0A1D2MSU2_ORCCI|nr:hypothetical protein Ocin01_10683 [Orchesella cincta]